MCQHLENIAIQISFEVYAARVALKCKLEKFINHTVWTIFVLEKLLNCSNLHVTFSDKSTNRIKFVRKVKKTKQRKR